MIKTRYKVILAALVVLAAEESIPAAVAHLFPLKKEVVLQYIADLPKPYRPASIHSYNNNCQYVSAFLTFRYELCAVDLLRDDSSCDGRRYSVRARDPTSYLGAWDNSSADRMITNGRFVADFGASGKICALSIEE